MLAVVLAILLFAGGFSQPARADASFSFFYSNLSPYGTWVVSSNYGRVWRPYEYEPGWNPYYDGRWAYTDYGWAWVSDYPWGAVPYHYGTWFLDPYLGWVWIPGYIWAPSWVVFSSGPDYIGWAPVPPRFVVGASVRFDDFGGDRFVFVPARSFMARRLRGHVVPYSTVKLKFKETKIVSNITVQNNVVVNRGLDPRDIEKVAGTRIRPVPAERVEKMAPARQFDLDQVRVDRKEHGGRPRATTPEPAQRSEPAKQPEPREKPKPAAQPEPSSVRQDGQEPQQERARDAGPTEKPPQQPANPPKARKQPKPQKPPKPPSGDHGGH
jgi:Family of unknown function (DUF6600)